MAMTADEQAALAGFTSAFFNSVPELRKIWAKARKEQWDGVRIVAAMRKTKWFRTHTENQRQLQLLKSSDPKEYAARRTKVREQVLALNKQLGTYISGKHIETVTNLAFAHGWGESQLRAYMGGRSIDFVRRIKSGAPLSGVSGQADLTIKQLARDYGIALDANTRLSLVRNMTSGHWDANYARNWFVNKAKSTYIGLAPDIEGGLTVRQAAQSYIDSMARLWELNPEDIDLRFDNTIRRALTSRNKEGHPVAQPLWQFEGDLRKNKRWLSTNNGREAIFGGGYRALQDMGLVF